MLDTNEARIEISTMCNYSCIFCPHKTLFSRPKKIMSTETFIILVDKLKKELPHITDITLSGMGEIFLDYDILKKIEYCKKLGYKIHILTNGSLLNKIIIESLNKLKVDDIRISLHSMNFDHYSKITSSYLDIYERVIDNIDYIVDNTTIPLILTFAIIDEINPIDLEAVKKKYNSNDITIEVWKVHNWADGFDYREGEAEKSTCGRPTSGPYQIQIDGTVIMCCFDFNGIMVLGDFLTQTMEEIFSGDLYNEIKDSHINNTISKTDFICKKCDQLKDKTDILIYNNKFENTDRVNRTSTSYEKLR